ncbi:hypothetical protein DWB77_03598 [Streptomyces hundungensis]|uniref:Uncharacterized protein n=1 Tax=Streptomyces hundungensis TaxID=1077946 RepID=A0A387HFN2_9ACTN|nr:hypothetical protein DWB77_03598 [Streptomyces hundungensis]
MEGLSRSWLGPSGFRGWTTVGDRVAGGFEFQWALTGSGWATYRITDGVSEHSDVPSYCTDALADLLAGVAGLYGSEAPQRVSFDMEPAEVRWVLRAAGKTVTIDIHRFPDLHHSSRLPDGDGECVWSSVQPRRVVAHAVLEAAQGLLDRHGAKGYLKKWAEHPFPAAELGELRRLHRERDDCAH